MAVKKYKKLTRAQKKLNADVKKELIEQGILPPPKPKLNRKKFAKETKEEFENYIGAYTDISYIMEAISWMTAGSTKVTSEQVGALKILKLAVELKKFKEAKRAQGEVSYKVMDLFKDVVDPILKL